MYLSHDIRTAVVSLRYFSVKRHNNTLVPLGVSAEASQHPQWAEVFMNGREVEECVCVCARVSEKVSGSPLFLLSPSSFFLSSHAAAEGDESQSRRGSL